MKEGWKVRKSSKIKKVGRRGGNECRGQMGREKGIIINFREILSCAPSKFIWERNWLSLLLSLLFSIILFSFPCQDVARFWINYCNIASLPEYSRKLTFLGWLHFPFFIGCANILLCSLFCWLVWSVMLELKMYGAPLWYVIRVNPRSTMVFGCDLAIL